MLTRTMWSERSLGLIQRRPSRPHRGRRSPTPQATSAPSPPGSSESESANVRAAPPRATSARHAAGRLELLRRLCLPRSYRPHAGNCGEYSGRRGARTNRRCSPGTPRHLPMTPLPVPVKGGAVVKARWKTCTGPPSGDYKNPKVDGVESSIGQRFSPVLQHSASSRTPSSFSPTSQRCSPVSPSLPSSLRPSLRPPRTATPVRSSAATASRA